MITPEDLTVESYREYLSGPPAISASHCFQPDKTPVKTAAAVAAFALTLLIGTGGQQSPQQIKAAVDITPRTSSAFRLSGMTAFGNRTHGDASEGSEITVGTPRDLAFIQHVLSLNMSEFASVLQVSRPTLYSWFNGVTPQSANLSRIETLSGLASDLDKSSVERPSGWLRSNPLRRSRVIAALAAEDPIDAAECLEKLRAIYSEPMTSPKNYAKLFWEHGIPERSIAVKRARVEEETGL